MPSSWGSLCSLQPGKVGGEPMLAQAAWGEALGGGFSALCAQPHEAAWAAAKTRLSSGPRPAVMLASQGKLKHWPPPLSQREPQTALSWPCAQPASPAGAPLRKRQPELQAQPSQGASMSSQLKAGVVFLGSPIRLRSSQMGGELGRALRARVRRAVAARAARPTCMTDCSRGQLVCLQQRANTEKRELSKCFCVSNNKRLQKVEFWLGRELLKCLLLKKARAA